jgi:hypothetical protein
MRLSPTLETNKYMPSVDLISTRMKVVENATSGKFGANRRPNAVYNHVLKLDLKSRQWSLVDNYGDIPGVRMGKLTVTPELRRIALTVTRAYRIPLAGPQAARFRR